MFHLLFQNAFFGFLLMHYGCFYILKKFLVTEQRGKVCRALLSLAKKLLDFNIKISI